MDKRTFFDNIRKEANVALAKVFDKVEEVSKTSALRLKINSLKVQIKDSKREIGSFVVANKADFEQYQEIKEQLVKIARLEDEIDIKKEQIADLKEKEEKEEDTKEEESNSFSL